MERRTVLKLALGTALGTGMGLGAVRSASAAGKEIVYLTPGLDLPFWRALSKGVEAAAKDKGFTAQTFDSHNSAQTQLQNAQDAITRGVAGIVFQPLATGDFRQIVDDMTEVLSGTGSEMGSSVETKDDEFGYRWMIVRDLDIEDLAVGVNAVSDALAVGGYNDRVLAAVFAFEDADLPFDDTTDRLKIAGDPRSLTIIDDPAAANPVRAIATLRGGTLLGWRGYIDGAGNADRLTAESLRARLAEIDGAGTREHVPVQEHQDVVRDDVDPVAAAQPGEKRALAGLTRSEHAPSGAVDRNGACMERDSPLPVGDDRRHRCLLRVGHVLRGDGWHASGPIHGVALRYRRWASRRLRRRSRAGPAARP